MARKILLTSSLYAHDLLFGWVMETSVHVPTRSLAVICAAASLLGRINPKFSTGAVMTGKIRRFMMLLLLAAGSRSLALAMEHALRLEEHITVPVGRLRQRVLLVRRLRWVALMDTV
jgi:hypothetical protein